MVKIDEISQKSCNMGKMYQEKKKFKSDYYYHSNFSEQFLLVIVFVLMSL